MTEQTIDPGVGEGVAAGGNGAPPVGDGGVNAGGDTQPAGGAQPSWQPPDWLPEHMRADDPTATLQNVWKAYEGYQKAHKQAGPVPEKPDAYTFELPDTLKQKGVQLGDDDPALKLWREVAHQAGLGTEQFRKAVPAFLEKAAEAGLLQPPIDVEKELLALGEEAGAQTPEEMAQAGKKRLAAVADFVNQMKTRGVLGEAEADAMLDLAVDAAGVRALEKIMTMVRNNENAVPGAAPGFVPQPMSQADVDALIRDERYDTRSPKHDPAYRAEADRKINAFYASQAGL